MAAKRKTRFGQRPPLTRPAVLEAAAALADEVGLNGLSMRRLGRALGVEAMSLYNHVPNKEAILDGLVDRVFAEIDPPAQHGEWKLEMRRTAISKRKALLRHRWATGLLESRTNPGPANLRHHEAILGCLRNAGFTSAEAVHAYSAIDSYVYGFALQQISLPFDSPAEHREVIQQMLQSIPLDDHPNLREVGMELVSMGYDHSLEFEYGLDLILDGLEGRLTSA